MTRLVLVCSVFAMSFIGCATPRAIPDPTVPHQLSRPAKATIWVEQANGKLVEVPVQLPKGTWVASPELIDPAP